MLAAAKLHHYLWFWGSDWGHQSDFGRGTATETPLLSSLLKLLEHKRFQILFNEGVFWFLLSFQLCLLDTQIPFFLTPVFQKTLFLSCCCFKAPFSPKPLLYDWPALGTCWGPTFVFEVILMCP